MFGSLGAPELIIIGLIVVLLFGVGKISGLGREVGSSIKEFRKAVKDPDDEAAKAAEAQAQVTPPQVPQYVQPPVYQQPPQQYPPQQPPQYQQPPQQYAPQQPPQYQQPQQPPAQYPPQPPQQQYAAPAPAPQQAPAQQPDKTIF